MAGYATLLGDHVTLTCRSVDRIFLQAYVPRLQSVGMVCQFLRWQRGYPIPSSAVFGKIGEAYAAEVRKFAKRDGIPVRYFAKGEKKEEIARPYIEAAAAGGKGAVALIGIAQEKASVWRSWPARGQLLGFGEFVVESAGQDQALRHIEYLPYPEQLYLEVCGLIFKEKDESPD